jgi:putative DNA primase/helicase
LEIEQQFKTAMEAAGLGGATEIIGDGKIQRYTVDGDRKGSENGWYILHLDDTPAGSFGSWKTGEKHSWSSKEKRPINPEDRSRWAEKKREREEEQAKVYAEARGIALTIWELAETNGVTQYLRNKEIPLIAARIQNDQVIVPVRNAKSELTSLQFISDDGSKKFLPGGEVQGSYCTIFSGKVDPTRPIIICEGYATGVSIFKATELPTVVAFNTGNIKPVSEIIRAKFPKTPIIIAADNDQWTEKPIKNPGIHYATIAAQAIDASVSAPEFKDTRSKPTDFNDLARQEGLGAVAEQILPAPPEPDPEPAAMSVPEVITFDDTDTQAVTVIATRPTFVTTISDWPFVTGGKNPKPVSNIENVKHLLELNGIEVRYDVIRKDMQVKIPNESYLIDTEKNDKMTRIVSVCLTSGLKAQKVEDFVAHIAAQNPYNPVAEWVLSKPWDRKSRMMDFFNTIKAIGEADEKTRALKNTILTRWMISAIAAAFNPNGISARGVLVFTGAQYIGKTNWFKNLVPQDLRLTKDGMLLKPDDRDSVYQIVSNWLVELGEVDATFRKSDIAQLKAFITKSEDTIRLPYRRDPASFARRTVFFASVNDRDYLADPTGNTRFWTIECESIDHTHGLDMQQVWAEFYALYKAGESWYMTHDETMALNGHNTQFQVVSPLKELILSKYDWDNDAAVRSVRPLTATEIAIELGYRNPNQKDTRSIASALREMSVSVTTSKGAVRFKMPDLKAEPIQRSEFRPWE